MNVALIASSDLRHPGPIERYVTELSRGLARRGSRVELLLQDPGRRAPSVSESGGVLVRRFPSQVGQVRVAVARELWKHLHSSAASFDLVDAHSAHLPLAHAAARARPRRLVFSPHAPIQRLLRWPYARLTRVVVDRSTRIVCRSRAEAELLCSAYPSAARRVHVLPAGVDAEAIQAAKPYPAAGNVVLSVGWLQRHERVERTIAAMVGLDPEFRLIVAGDGPRKRRLRAYARDLALSSRVEFVGPVSDEERYRWLRTARVVTALSERHSSGRRVLEALAAGTPVVAADNPIHREVASYVGGAGLTFVSPEGSPLEVADGIVRATGIRVPSTARLGVPTRDAAVISTLALYESLVDGRGAAAEGGEGIGRRLPRRRALAPEAAPRGGAADGTGGPTGRQAIAPRGRRG
jgi:glycosyltransferase involved in cell wall biosynthesis